MNHIEFGKRILFNHYFDMINYRNAMEKHFKISTRIAKLKNEFAKINGVRICVLDDKLGHMGNKLTIPVIEYELSPVSSVLLTPLEVGISNIDCGRPTLIHVGNISGIKNRKIHMPRNTEEMLTYLKKYVKEEIVNHNIKLTEQKKKEITQFISLIEYTYNLRKKVA